ncbi:MAG: hypothetical protein QOH20_4668 [Mycobacterium sp.]|jgi:TolB protein|nr:hypothetical protein [Mycobacterium sp.]
MNRKTAVIAALAAVMVAGCASSTHSTAAHDASGSAASPTSTSTEAAPAAHGVEAAIGAVPWPQVGPGWLLATWSPVSGGSPAQPPVPGEPSPGTATTTLYLVDPAGGRYAITTFPPPGDMAGPQLVDWSGDGSQALFYAEYAKPPAAILVDLHTGAQTPFPVNGSPRFTRPDGKALLVATRGYTSHPGSLTSVDLAGNPQLNYPVGSDFGGGYLSTPDGTRLVLGTPSGLALMGNDGTGGNVLPMQGQTDCSPLRWWDGNRSTTVLARCEGSDGSGTRLWLVPTSGATPTALTAPNNGQKGPDLGDADAWQLRAGTFVQALGACGVVYLAKLNADGTTAPVSVPDVQSDSVVVVGVHGNDLHLQAKAGCGSGQALLSYDTTAAKSTVLLGPPINGGGVIDAVAYPGQE